MHHDSREVMGRGVLPRREYVEGGLPSFVSAGSDEMHRMMEMRHLYEDILRHERGQEPDLYQLVDWVSDLGRVEVDPRRVNVGSLDAALHRGEVRDGDDVHRVPSRMLGMAHRFRGLFRDRLVQVKSREQWHRVINHAYDAWNAHLNNRYREEFPDFVPGSNPWYGLDYYSGRAREGWLAGAGYGMRMGNFMRNLDLSEFGIHRKGSDEWRVKNESQARSWNSLLDAWDSVYGEDPLLASSVARAVEYEDLARRWRESASRDTPGRTAELRGELENFEGIPWNSKLGKMSR